MLREILLLTGAREAPHLTAYLARHNPDLRIVHVETREDLICALHPGRPGLRLIGFCTPTVVPAGMLNEFEAGAYNFHPGPPTYPGRHPASFAIYEGATRFAATAHEMRARVDSGPIIGVEWFDMPQLPRLSQVEDLTYDAAVRLFSKLGPLLATATSPLPVIDTMWSGRKSTQRDFEAMCALPTNIDAAELERRVRAFADGLQGSLNLTVHGRRFKLMD
jgi:methionyl-tRNA formyltransferase